MVTTKAVAKVAAVATGLAMATSMLSLAPMAHAAALTSAQVQSILSLLTSFGADSTTIANVQASLTGGTPTGTGSVASSSCNFTRNLTVGSQGADVTCLQNALKAGGYMSANATGYFGALTKAGVIAWQKAAGVSPAAGYFGALSRAAFGGVSAGAGAGAGAGASAGTGTGLKISLDSTSPAGTVLVQGQGIGLLARFRFANPTANPINVTALTFNRTGVSNDSALTNVYLYNNGMRITDSAGVSSSAFSYSNPAGIFTVPAGGVYVLGVRSDIAGSTQGQQIGINLVSATASAALDSSVSFPVVGGFQTVSAANLANVSYGGNTTPASTSISPQVNFPIWQNTLTVSTNPVKLSSMKFSNLGSISASYVTNLRLYVDGVQAGSSAPALNADGTITFDLSANPVLLSTQSHTIKLLSDVTGGANRTIIMSVQRSSDAMFVDNQLGQPVTPTNNGSTFSAISAGTVTINSVSNTSGISTSLDPSSPTNSVAVGSTNVKWGTFDMLASGENVKVTDLYVFASSTASGGGTAGVGGLQNGKVFLNGVQVGSTKNIGQLVANVTDFAMGSSLILPMGQTVKVDIYADAKDTGGTNLPANATSLVTLHAVSNNAQGQSSLNSATVPATDITSTALTLSTSSLTATKYTGYGNQIVIAGANNAKLGSFTLSTGSTEGVTVNTIVLTMSAANAASITNLTIKDDATGNTLGTVITTPSASNSFAVNFDVPVSSTKVIDVYGNVLSTANAGPIVLTVDPTTAGTGDLTGISASPTSQALQTITVGTGTLSVAAGANYQTSNNVLAGAAAANVGEFTFSASNSAFTVNNLAILVPNGLATSVTNVTVTYPDINGVSHSTSAALAVNSALQYTTATFTGLAMYVPMNSTANLDVAVGIPTIASGATSGTGVKVLLDSGSTNGTDFSATNSAGTVLKVVNSGTDVSSGGTFYVRKTIPTFAMLSTGVSVPSTGSPIYKFTVSADPAGALEWTKLVFNVSTSTTPVTLTNVYLTDDSSGTNLLDNTTSSASTTQTTITIDLTKNDVQPEYQQVAAGATKTYDLYGTVSGFGAAGSTLTLSLAADTSVAVPAVPSSVSGNFIWSDRSASPHVSPSFGGAAASADYTNGYLVKNFTSNATTYSK